VSAGAATDPAWEVTRRAREHAERIVAGDPGALADLAPGAPVEPADLFDRLLAASFTGFELVAHARVGAHHVLKTKYAGPTTIVVQARWAVAGGGRWQVHEVEIARVAVERA
jgi:hypothetical protein